MLKVGVTTGLYYVARADELATIVKKIGYGLTRGTDVIEISGDVPHEVDYTDGKEVRYISEKQGLDLLFHGSLTVPLEIPERSDWRDAHDHMQKSIRSAINSGCKYTLFHACLHFWVEMLTYVGTKLEITMCDHLGNFISEILYQNQELRDWFIGKVWELGEGRYPNQILDHEESAEAANKAHAEMRIYSQRESRKVEEAVSKKAAVLKERLERGLITKAQYDEEFRNLNEEMGRMEQAMLHATGVMESKNARRYMEERIKEKMADKDKVKREWNVKTYGRLSDAYKIMAHYMFYTKDPIWLEMAKMYKDTVVDKYKIDYKDKNWLDVAWDLAERNNDRVFKEFYYAAVGAKFMEGHVRKLLEWLEGDLINKELKNKPELMKYAKDMKITFEIPDARDPKYAGLYILFHPKQLYAAVKTIRKTLNTDRIFMTMDFEHMATQGLDPVEELEVVMKLCPDYGKYIISVHSNSPNPLHSHYPIELGDIKLYKCLLYLRKTGMGKEGRNVFLLFERGGGDDPFKQAVDALKLMARFLEKDMEPDDLPIEFYGLKMMAGDEKRQLQIIMDHRFEPLKDLLETPEEDWTFLSSNASRKGKQKEFKKGEMR
jgi:sugar phosphate isomerase/epimerase